jgi:putative oxidoreductase
MNKQRIMRKVPQAIASWEGYLSSLLRVILAFAISLHGYHKLFGVFVLGGRSGNPTMALEVLPPAFAVLEVTAGMLLFLGFWTRPAAALLCVVMTVAYFHSVVQHGIWPLRNGSEEATIEGFALLYFAVSGASTWSLDHFLRKSRQDRGSPDSLAQWIQYIVSFVRIAIAMLFLQHGLEKFFGFPTGLAVNFNLFSERGLAGALELGGGVFLTLGLFSRATAFILSGEMAVVYFTYWVPRNAILPIRGSEEAILFCFFFLWLIASGPGPVSLDSLIERRREHKSTDSVRQALA